MRLVKSAFMRLILLSFFFCFCSTVKAQTFAGETYTYIFQGGLCSSVYKFINDSLYSRNDGCENAGRTSYGKYFLKNDTMHLEYGFKNSSFRLLAIDSSKTPNAIRISIKFIDQNGNNVTQLFKVNHSRTNGRTYSLTFDSLNKTLFAPNFDVTNLHVTTFAKAGIVANFTTEFKKGLDWIVFVNLDRHHYRFLNKNTIYQGEGFMIIKKDKLIPENHSEYVSLFNEPVIFTRKD